MATDDDTRKQRAREADRRRKARKKAAKLGLPGPPLLRTMKPKRKHAKTPEEKAQRKIERKEQQRLSSALWRSNHPEQRKTVVRESNARHRDSKNQSNRDYSARPETREKKRQRKHIRLATEPQFKIRASLASRMLTALRRVTHGVRKQHGTITLIGCTIPELMSHLEAQFAVGMTWENYGTLWQIDHRKPCSSYDLTDPQQQLECFRWSNLQPLLAVDNIRKGAKLDWPPPLKKAA